MVQKWKYQFRLFIFIVLQLYYVASQTTTTESPTSTTTTNLPDRTTNSFTTTNFNPTLLPFLTTEGTTLATADSATQTTSLAAEEIKEEATTEGQASNEAGRGSSRGRGFRFEPQRNRPNANQEAAPEPDTQTTKPEEKKAAWKFGRGGNNPDSWAPRPDPNSGYPFWKKQVGGSSGDSSQSTESPGQNKPNDQAYIVWSVGQGNQANGWSLGENARPWAPPGTTVPAGGWATSDANPAPLAPQPGSWNAAGWTEDQSSNSEEPQSGWVDEQVPDEDSGAQEGWDDGSQGSWDPQNGKSGGWVNGPPEGPPQGPPQGPPPNTQQSNAWRPQNNAEGSWAPGDQQNDDGGGWDSSPQDDDWEPDSQSGDAQDGQNGDWNNNGGGPGYPGDNSWNNGAQGNGGWNNEGPNSNGWDDGPAGGPDGDVAWKVYNEDTQTMENIDENSGWKVVGDGGPGGWKLIDANGNIEWKIENINGEWKVTSADNLSKSNDTSVSPPTDSTNKTAVTTNGTSAQEPTTAAPTGGWDDKKQGRYVIWKFSEDGTGEAKVYGGEGAEPEVWTVGDNNQWWKEAVGVKGANPTIPGGSSANSWPGNNAWKNPQQQSGSGWQTNGKSGPPAPAPPKSSGWQSGGNTPKAPTSSPQNGNTWQNRPAPQSNGWRGGAGNRNRWQQKNVSNSNKNRNNGVRPPAQAVNGWQNQAAPSSGWNGNNAQPNTKGWRNRRPNTQPNSAKQPAWKNRGSQSASGWSNGGTRKGDWRNNGNGSTGRWVPKNGNGARKKSPASGRVWNNRNSWNAGTNTQKNRGWTKTPPGTNVNPPNPPAYQNSGNKPGQGGGWSGKGGGGQNVPYIIIIKSPDSAASDSVTSSWRRDAVGNTGYKRTKNSNGKDFQNSRRNNGWKMNKAGSSGWQWNPQGNGEWQWRDGWMGSGGGFGGWMSDKGAMYSNWKPTRPNGPQSRKNTQRSSSGKGSKKSGNKMVFVFGTKRNASNSRVRPGYTGVENGKQVIILDYSTGAKKIPKGEDDMKKDIESVIQALKVAKPSGVRRTTVHKQPKPTGQPGISKTQRWS